ncbi:ogr/Delta-like zinc finger family protein [Budvicia aquatica]
MRCKKCGYAAHARSSYEITITTKERYYQCINIECSHTFIAHETYVRSIVSPGSVEPVSVHPVNNTQASLQL